MNRNVIYGYAQRMRAIRDPEFGQTFLFTREELLAFARKIEHKAKQEVRPALLIDGAEISASDRPAQVVAKLDDAWKRARRERG